MPPIMMFKKAKARHFPGNALLVLLLLLSPLLLVILTGDENFQQVNIFHQ